MPNPLLNLGSAINDHTGTPLRTAGQLLNRLPNPDSTINAGSGDYTGTKEQKITAAIAAAAAAGIPFVFIPASFLPYNPALVTFLSAVHVLRENSRPDVFDVVAYGALGNGTGDDTVGIQAAITAAAGALPNLFDVWFPAGTYTISNQGSGWALQVNNGLRLIGPPSAILQAVAGQAIFSEMLRINTTPSAGPVADVTVEGLTFDSNLVKQLYGIRAMNTLRLTIRGCRFKRFRETSFGNNGYCIYASGYQATPPASPYAWGATAPVNFSQGTLVSGCFFTDNGTTALGGCEAVFLYYHDSASIIGNYAQASGKLGYVDGWNRRVTIADNIIEDGWDSGIRVGPDDSIAGTKPQDCEGITISGNVIRNCVKDGIRATGNRLTVTGNVCERNTLSGIASVVSIDSLFQGNQCFANANAGIQLVRTTITGYGPHKNVKIEGNHCSFNSGHGIDAEGGGDTSAVACSGIHIIDNECGNNGFNGINLQDYDKTCDVSYNKCYGNGTAVNVGSQFGIEIQSTLATLATTGGARVEHNRCYDIGGSPTQGVGIAVVSLGSGGGMGVNYLRFNDCSDHPVVTNFNGTPIRTKFGGEAAISGQVIFANYERNCTLSLRGGFGTGILHANDALVLVEDNVNSLAFLNAGRINDNIQTFTIAGAGSNAPDLSLGSHIEYTFSGATATILAPTNIVAGQLVTMELFNNSGAGLTITWNAAWLGNAQITAPATTKRRVVLWRARSNGTQLILQQETGADI